MRDVTRWVSRARVLGIQQREESQVELYHAWLLLRTGRRLPRVSFDAAGLESSSAAETAEPATEEVEPHTQLWPYGSIWPKPRCRSERAADSS